jgi:pSer/pThr/pTyr-binding forkhead associated (FHA) protein
MAKLVVNTGASQGRELELRQGVNSFGRGPACDFRFTDSSMSAMHAEIIVEANSVTLKDLRSTNGTFINRSQIREGFLQSGQTVSLGGVEMLFVADSVESTVDTGGVARTVALPQVGGIKIARPADLPAPGGMRGSPNYPAPMMPTPVLTTTPTGFGATTGRPQAQPAPMAAPERDVDATWRHVEPVRSREAGVWRCIGFGFGAAVISAAVWIAIAAVGGRSPAAVTAGMTGLICGLGMRVASRGRPALEFSLLAAGFALLGMFIGECGQVLVLQTVSFEGFNLAGLLAGLAAAALIGGTGTGKPRLA